MIRCVPTLYTNPRDVRDCYYIKQFLRFGGLATGIISTVIGIYHAISDQTNENTLEKCVIGIAIGLGARMYSSTIQVLREDGKRASLKDIMKLEETILNSNFRK